MIEYALVCNEEHNWQAWFANAASFEKQCEKGLVRCPYCNSRKVRKALMTPALGSAGRRRGETALKEGKKWTEEMPVKGARTKEIPSKEIQEVSQPSIPKQQALVSSQSAEQKKMHALYKAMRQVQDKILKEHENVGNKFSEEARKIHYGEVAPRGIYGEASKDEVEEMREEGIAIAPLPLLPKLDS